MKDSDLIFGLMASFGKKEYSVADLIHLTKPFKVTENSLRTNLSRLKNNAVIKAHRNARNVFYSFYKRGKKMELIADLSFNPLKWDTWNGEWLSVIFSVSEKNKDLRYQLRKRLKTYHFAPQYPGFWIRPYHQTEYDKYNFKKIFNFENVKLIKFSYLNQLDTYDIQKIWNIQQLNAEFIKGINIISKHLNTFKSISPERALVKKMELGEILVDLIFKDPLLPPALLPPGWKGNDLRIVFFNLDKTLTEISKPYWNKIFN